jgi:hypothetical protein
VKATRVKLRSGHHDVVVELTSDGLHLYTSCCGARVSRRKAEKLRRLLKAHLIRTSTEG